MKILIVGGVAGGAAAAARARRLSEKAEIIIFERGNYISFANCGLPYYAGNVITQREQLILQTPQSFSKRFNVDIRVLHEVKNIDIERKEVKILNISTNQYYNESYDCLILSPGAEPFIPPIPGAISPNTYKLRNIPDIDAIKSRLDSGKIKTAVVIGAGFIGIEMAENLRHLNIETHIIEKLDQVLPPLDKDMSRIIEQHLIENGVNLHLNEEVVSIKDNGGSSVISTKNGTAIACDMIIFSIGVKPEIELAKSSGLKLLNNAIYTDNNMQTSNQFIYAVGDAVSSFDPISNASRVVPLAGPAAKQALVAVNNIFGIKDSYQGTIGTAILKIFSLTCALTGNNEKTLKINNIGFNKVYTHPLNHAGYYPGASQMSIKLIFDNIDGKVLGAQIIGKDGVDKRIDILSVACQHKLKVEDLSKMELSYAPPYGSAKDPINLAGMAALNHIRGISKLEYWENLKEDDFLLDVRTEKEVSRAPVKNAYNIPVDSLRQRINEVPQDKKIAVFCHVGVRAHSAVRILMQNGFNAVNISGGFLTYKNL